MTIAAGLETRLALAGTVRFARGDRRALDCFDRSLDGFWRSFRAAVICYPLFLILLTMRVDSALWQASGAARIVTVETIAYVISWAAFPLIMLNVTRWLGRADRFFDFMVPYNWSQLPQSALFVLIGLEGASGLLGGSAAQLIEIAGGIGVLVYEWYIAWVALATSRTGAVFVVMVDLVLGMLIDHASTSLY
jgi:hypothetical protein